MREENAERMIGKEGWIATDEEAYRNGLVHSVMPPNKLMNASIDLARECDVKNEEEERLYLERPVSLALKIKIY